MALIKEIQDMSKFIKADYEALDAQFPQWDQTVKDAVDYVEYAFSRSWNQDAAWQPFMLAAMSRNRNVLVNTRTINAFNVYDNMILPFYDSLKLSRPPNSRRTNFTGGRLGNKFNNEGPFVFGGTATDGSKMPKHMWTLKPAYTKPEVWKVIDHYWKQRLAKGFQTGSRAKKAEEQAGTFLAGDHAAFARTDVDFRAQDAGVDGRASFMGKWVPSQVKEFPVSKNEVHAYMMSEPAYKKGGALVAPKFKQDAVDYIKKQRDNYNIEFYKMDKTDLLGGSESQSKIILMWSPK
jgi:hypothetical protein